MTALRRDWSGQPGVAGTIFNVGNASTIVSYGASVGSAYLRPREIVAPRIVRVGFNVDF